MKQLLFCTMVVAQALAVYGQANEFTVYPNGLVYSDNTMQQLRHIVDSLNLRFRHCDPTKKYYSAEQGLAQYIDLESSQAPEAFHDIQAGIPFNDFVKKYKPTTIDSNLLLTRTTQKNRRLLDIDYYFTEKPDNNSENYIDLCHTPPGALEEDRFSIKGIKGNWLFDFTKAVPEQQGAHLRAFYISRPLAVAPVPDRYAKLILYADCMIDTTAGIFYPDAWDNSTWVLFGNDRPHPHDRIDTFNAYIHRETIDRFKNYYLLGQNTREWKRQDSLLKKYVRDSLSNTPCFRQLLSEATEEALRYKAMTNDNFEYYVATYSSKSAALSMKRNRKITGTCSMDDRPRQHAINIAVLAAETGNWVVFLRAHLDIMNDRVERVAYNNYAQAACNTYIREIEELDIDVQDLLLGISFNTSGAPANHYFGSIGRLGRAFAETKYSTSLEEKLLAMIADNELDDLNRLRMRNLFLGYVYYLPRKDERMACLQQLEEADKTLPAFIASGIKTNRALYEQGNVRR